MTKNVQYQQGQTKVWSDGEKVVITNSSGKKHIEHNFDQIFELGEFAKLYKVKINESIKPGVINPLSKSVEIISNYVPKKVLEDLKGKSQVDKFFKKEETV